MWALYLGLDCKTSFFQDSIQRSGHYRGRAGADTETHEQQPEIHPADSIKMFCVNVQCISLYFTYQKRCDNYLLESLGL